ncbi:hypothetical protein KRR40_13725 [Niabella defluvii]|nr:hypothetical protein KRR40_13725 [Niabella sp. I65]
MSDEVPYYFLRSIDALTFKPIHKVNALQASRRGFLSNLAILTAGVAMGGNTSGLFITEQNAKPDNLETVWESFCKSRLSSPYLLPIENRREIEACKGHEHREGKAVYFPEEGVVAQPVWIYWAANKNKPSDVIVNFYNDDVAIVSLNQFELMALYETRYKAGPLTAFLKANNGERLYVTQTRIGVNNHTSTRLTIVEPQDVLA